MERDCHNCYHAGCDPDGPFCGHPETFKISEYGLSFTAARRDNGPCKPEAVLFSHKDELPFA